MVITNQIETMKGTFTAEYHDADDFGHLPYQQCTQAYGVCFYQDLVVICKTRRNSWILPGGTIEPNESFTQTLAREVQEESNMNVLLHQPIGYQKVWSEQAPPIYQLRFYCQVEPYGLFEKDMADDGGDIIGIWQVIPDQVADLLNWGPIGERIMERANLLHSQHA